MNKDSENVEDLLAKRLLSLKPGIRPDDVTSFYYDRGGVRLTLKILSADEPDSGPSVLIEGDDESLLFLADLILAQASDRLDCGFQIDLPKPGFLTTRSELVLYIHRLPCAHEPSPDIGSNGEIPEAE
jgi:hypothetical protein